MARPRNDPGSERRHVALVGFAGSGKTTVGKMVAQRLGATFIDLDETISKKANRSIGELFREHGEVGFRAYERAALREALETATPAVIATGGGTFVDASMRGWVQAAARTVYLRASPEVLLTRIGVGAGTGRTMRPLLSGPDPLATIKRLLGERGNAYEQCEITVTTNTSTCEEVVAELIASLKDKARQQPKRDERLAPGVSVRPPHDPSRAYKTDDRHSDGPMTPMIEDLADEPAEAGLNPDGTALLRVHASAGSYAVELRPEAGAWIADAIAAVVTGERVALISDDTVAGLYADALMSALAAQHKHVSLHTFAPGENSKTLDTAALLYDQLLAEGLTRRDAVVALGGGVVGDVAGFVASTFLRGIPFVQVPTTTLAAVDSSVGGKTGVNTPRGKNLVGTFYPPRAVLVAGAHLATQTLRQHVAGLVEAVKMVACLDGLGFAALTRDARALLAFDPQALARTVARAVAAKAGVVGRDEREEGERAVLNYGHTVGHAIEVGESFRLLHGEAVALGMLAEAAWAEATGRAHEVVAPLTALLASLGAPTRWRDVKVDYAAMGLDKKRQGSTVRLPIVTRIGSYELASVPLDELVHFVQARSG